MSSRPRQRHTPSRLKHLPPCFFVFNPPTLPKKSSGVLFFHHYGRVSWTRRSWCLSCALRRRPRKLVALTFFCHGSEITHPLHLAKRTVIANTHSFLRLCVRVRVCACVCVVCEWVSVYKIYIYINSYIYIKRERTIYEYIFSYFVMRAIDK